MTTRRDGDHGTASARRRASRSARGTHVGSGRPRRRGARRARRDRSRRRLPGQPRPAPLRAVRRHAARARRPARPPDTTERAAVRRLRLARARRGTAGRSSPPRPSSSLARRGSRIWTRPIKGTRPRGRRAELLASAKDAAEHVMIVDLERNDLSRVCLPGSVRWPQLMAPEPLAGVEHLVSTVEGELRPGVGLAEILGATFPGGSITGAPKIAAVDLIAAHRAGRSRCVDGGARTRPRERRPRARAHDPDVRDRRRAPPPVGRRRHRLGLRPGRGGRGVARRRRRRCSTRSAPRSGRGALRVSSTSGELGGERRPLAAAVSGRGVVDPDDAVVACDDEGFARGRAAFETLRVYDGGPFRLAEHVDRLVQSAARIGLPAPDAAEVSDLAGLALAAAGSRDGDAVLRLYWTPGPPGGRGDCRRARLAGARTGSSRRGTAASGSSRSRSRRVRHRGCCPARSP